MNRPHRTARGRATAAEGKATFPLHGTGARSLVLSSAAFAVSSKISSISDAVTVFCGGVPSKTPAKSRIEVGLAFAFTRDDIFRIAASGQGNPQAWRSPVPFQR